VLITSYLVRWQYERECPRDEGDYGYTT
jgi:hypothetical protein